jgi:hypothetical protein
MAASAAWNEMCLLRMLPAIFSSMVVVVTALTASMVMTTSIIKLIIKAAPFWFEAPE